MGLSMGDVNVRNLSDTALALLKSRAKRRGKSLESELRGILIEEAFRPQREWADRLAKLRAEIFNEQGQLPDSTPGIREERDRRG